MKPFSAPITPGDVGELIDFSVIGDPETQSMALMQREGVAALYNILCKRNFTYLADEVGMGKTYQAMGLAAVLWNEKPDARILFISPRENLQGKWFDDYKRFFASNYRRQQKLGDDRVASVLFGEPLHRPELFQNLRSWTPTLGMPERMAAFVRHTSFTRPVFVDSKDKEDMEALWSRSEKRMHGWGLFNIERPANLNPDNASHELNITFAHALNAKLKSESQSGPYFDLVIVDEAQCLRHPENQTNQVLFESLRGQADKWLFMSATPAHGGPSDIPTILNRYPDSGTVLDPELVHDLPAMQEELQEFMVRRQRRYRIQPSPETVGKDRYRKHDPESWSVKDADMSVLGTLAMGLVQKGLVDVLEGKNNRYRIGFLSSFESLQSSLSQTLTVEDSEAAPGDWHRDQGDGASESNAPDTGFINQLTSDFEARFNMSLPHPKIASVVDRVASLAFGSDTEIGGHKFLIFTRRVSTVKTLRDELTRRYLMSIEDRIRRYWKPSPSFDWDMKSDALENEEEVDDPEAVDLEPGENPLRKAMSQKGWLFRYRQTFRASGRNALFFEDGWLQRLCAAGGVTPKDAAANLPERLWAESWTHAAKVFKSSQQQFRADRVRYLALHGLNDCPDVFGLTPESATHWRNAYETFLHNHLQRALPDDDPHVAVELFTTPTLWTQWDARFSGSELALPASGAKNIGAHESDELYRRQVARTLLGQNFRLNDTLLDLYFADDRAKSIEEFPNVFLDWLDSEDPGAKKIRHDCAQWLKHLRLIVDGCLEGAGRPWRELAREETWPILYSPTAVMGVTGGSGAHLKATRQFRTPSLPRVIVCTDTLKEGVDLHLFCDRVLHYGVAWTSGDLEQRVGRVDRYFSQIERRLSEGAPPDVELHVGYPHIQASLEQGQIARVIDRQRRAEQLMDSPLSGTSREGKDLVIGATQPRESQRTLEPYRPHSFPSSSHSVVSVSAAEAQTSADHYAAWYKKLRARVRQEEWHIRPDDDTPVRLATLYKADRQHDLRWTFDAALSRYIMTLSNPRWSDSGAFSGGSRKRMIGRSRKIESFLRMLVPTPEEGVDLRVLESLEDALTSDAPRLHPNAMEFWGNALKSLAQGEVIWVSSHKAQIRVPRGERAHTITLYAYAGSVRVVGIIAALEELTSRGAWRGTPSESNVREWLLEKTNDLSLGYLDIHEGNLMFGIHIVHGDLTLETRRRLLEEVAWRADLWEASLTGKDVY